jgi:hypothetical protein
VKGFDRKGKFPFLWLKYSGATRRVIYLKNHPKCGPIHLFSKLEQIAQMSLGKLWNRVCFYEPGSVALILLTADFWAFYYLLKRIQYIE